MNGPVVHITLGKANPERANGVSVAVHGLAVGLHGIGVPVEVWGITPTPEAATPERPYGLRLFSRTNSRFGLDPMLREALEMLPPSTLVHFHGGLLPEYFQIARLLHRCGVPWVITPHGCYSSVALKDGFLKKQVFIRLFDRFITRHAMRIHAVGPNSTDGLGDPESVSKTVYIPNGSPAPESPFADPGSSPFSLSFCGRLARHHKGLDLLWRGMTIARNEIRFLRLDVIGEGPDQVELDEIARALGVDGQIHMHGALFGNRKRALLADSSCFILTSRHEGFPMALVEAAALGLPLLVTEGTNFADYVRRWDCGMVTAQTTEEAIAETIVAMASSSPERLKEMGRNSVRMVRAELQWSRIAERIRDEIYRPIWAERS